MEQEKKKAFVKKSKMDKQKTIRNQNTKHNSSIVVKEDESRVSKDFGRFSGSTKMFSNAFSDEIVEVDVTVLPTSKAVV